MCNPGMEPACSVVASICDGKLIDFGTEIRRLYDKNVNKPYSYTHGVCERFLHHFFSRGKSSMDLGWVL